MVEGGCVKGEDDGENPFDLRGALEEMVARSNTAAKVTAVMPLERLDKAIFEPTLPWTVKGFIAYHRLGAYDRLCLENAGMTPAALWATHGEGRVRLVGVKGDQIVISPRGDRDSRTVCVSLTDLDNFGAAR